MPRQKEPFGVFAPSGVAYGLGGASYYKEGEKMKEKELQKAVQHATDDLSAYYQKRPLCRFCYNEERDNNGITVVRMYYRRKTKDEKCVHCSFGEK